jgi:hypothetical protein
MARCSTLRSWLIAARHISMAEGSIPLGEWSDVVSDWPRRKGFGPARC